MIIANSCNSIIRYMLQSSVILIENLKLSTKFYKLACFHFTKILSPMLKYIFSS